MTAPTPEHIDAARELLGNTVQPWSADRPQYAALSERDLRLLEEGIAATLAAEIRAAIAAEREQCAAYVEAFPRLLGYPVYAKNEPAYSRRTRLLCDDIASRIRDGQAAEQLRALAEAQS